MTKTKSSKIWVVATAVLSVLTCLGSAGTVEALAPVNTMTTQQLNTIKTITPALNSLTARTVSCKGSILSENNQMANGYRYTVQWEINATNVSSNNYFTVEYSGTNLFTKLLINAPPTDGSAFMDPLYFPIKIPPVNYDLKLADTSKTVNFKVLLDALDPDFSLNNTCSLDLTNKNLPAESDYTQLGVRGFVSPRLQESIPIPTPTNQTSPSYSFSSNKAGTLTYGGSCSADKVTAAVGNNVIVLNPLTPGTYSNCTITLTDSSGNKSPALTMSSFTIRSSSSGSTGDDTTNNPTSGSTDTNTGSTNTTGGSTATNGETSNTTETAAPELKPSPDIMLSRAQALTLYFENDQPAYDRLPLKVTLISPATVTVSIYKDSYDPKAEDNSDNLIKTLLLNAPKEKGLFTITWDGYDDYDQAVPLGKYKYVVEAKLNSTYKPDVSIQSFEIKNPPTAAETTAASAENVQADTLRGAAPEEPKPGLLEQVSTAIFGEEKAGVTEAAATEPAAPQKELSKCPGVYYPIDISGSPYESLIKKAYDECIISGYPDFTIRHQQYITRPEFIKMAMKAFGKEAKKGCYDADCGAGAPFTDMDMWMGPWVRAAWDLGYVQGIAPDKLGVGLINKAETVALTIKMSGIPPHQGCYTPNCGAGFPDNPFKDITQSWQGPYLRAAWDKGLIQAQPTGEFFPKQYVTRVQALDLLMRARSLK